MWTALHICLTHPQGQRRQSSDQDQDYRRRKPFHCIWLPGTSMDLERGHLCWERGLLPRTYCDEFAILIVEGQEKQSAGGCKAAEKWDDTWLYMSIYSRHLSKRRSRLAGKKHSRIETMGARDFDWLGIGFLIQQLIAWRQAKAKWSCCKVCPCLPHYSARIALRWMGQEKTSTR